MVKTTTLPSGLRIISQEMNGTEAITTLVMCGAGSRYETKQVNGISHFLEHMFFKGAKKYKDCKAVASAIDSIGGEFNAFTGKEYVGYYVTTPKEKYLKAFDVLSDMMLYPNFEQEEIERERGVIIEEMNMYEDLPMQKVHEHFEEQIFGDNPLGWEIIGSKKTVSSMNREDFIKYKNKQYVPSNIVISVFGSVSHDEAVSNVKKYFKFKEDSHEAANAYEFEKFNDSEKINLITKDTEQAHMVMGFPCEGSEDFHRKYVYSLLSIILGGNMSSRMFMSVRERQGLCYYISTSYSGYIGSGYFASSAGVDINRISNALEAIMNEYNKIAEEGSSDDELSNAKEYMKGKMTIGLEDSGSLAHFYAKQSILRGEVKTVDEIKKEIDSVTVEEINLLAKKILIADKIKVSIIGPYKDSKVFG